MLYAECIARTGELPCSGVFTGGRDKDCGIMRYARRVALVINQRTFDLHPAEA